MGEKKRNTAIYIISFALFVAGIAYLCFAGFSENSVYFLNVSEAAAVTPEKLKQARLFGLVSSDGLNKQINTVQFNLADKDNADQFIPVIYKGVVPDTFKAGAEVIVEGGMEDAGVFRASSLMTKCPSKYQKENRTN